MDASWRALAFVAAALLAAAPAQAQGRGRASRPAVPVSADSLRANLFRIADDSMGGRQTGEAGNVKTADWVAAEFARYGFEPAGENGTWFQTIPFGRLAVDTTSALQACGLSLALGRDVLPIGAATWRVQARALDGGQMSDSTSWPAPGSSAGRLVVLRPRVRGDLRGTFAALAQLRRSPRFADAAGFALDDVVAPDLADQIMQGQITADSAVPVTTTGVIVVSERAAGAMLGALPGAACAGPDSVTGRIEFTWQPLRYPVRNVVAVLPGSDPALKGTFVSISAHNDHVGFTRAPVDHDSTRAFNRVVRPMGADSRPREATPPERQRITALLDSLRASHPARRDSIFNGADDDGSGTVALVELARVLSKGPRPRRSVLLVSHAAEERGLLGSRWFTDHPTLARDSIVAEIDVDMIGRGGTTDLVGGGPGYLEVVGSKRLSTEFGTMLDTVAAHQGVPFHLNYEYDAPGHPLQYYCRADHFSYARYGIPAVSLSTGEHLDYHQVTDEPQYIDYAQLARVTALVRDLATAVANLAHRPVVDGPRGDPHGPCRQ